MLVPADLRILGLVAAAAAIIAIAVYVGLRAAGLDPARLLTPREWSMAGKIMAIALLAAILYQASVTFDFPPEAFIYGRF